MSFVSVAKKDQIGIITMSRGKVNALNGEMVDQIHECLLKAESDDTVRALILTGSGKFFTFGFDIPAFMTFSREEFSGYLEKFTNLYARIFGFPKPVIAALNGHTIAGGCMMATACDYRIMVKGKAKISLNEITFGSSVFAGNTSILMYCTGTRNAQEILYSGKMYSAEEALGLGLVDLVTSEEDLPVRTEIVAREFASKDPVAFRSIKELLRKPVLEEIIRSEAQSIKNFVEIWYSDSTRKHLDLIKIST